MIGSPVVVDDPGVRGVSIRASPRFPRAASLCHVGTAALLLMLAGCGLWRPVPVPMVSIAAPAHCATRPDTLLVLLPGSYSRPQEFVREGFVGAVRERGLAVDIVLVDAHLGYYSDRSIIDRLQADIVGPARAQGYTQIWLVGISIGAFGALIYTEAQPRDIAGVVALGPYLGKRSLTEEINAQGGLRRWRAPTGRLDPEDIDTQLWRWLQPPGSATPSRAMADPRPDLFLGYGRSDRFIFSDTLLAATLPSNRVFTTDGGHDWAAWLALWRSMLDAMPLRRDASCRPSL